MKASSAIILALALPLCAEKKTTPQADNESKKAADIVKIQKGTEKLATDQDKLSADVQDLIDEQTSEEVLEILNKVEELMGETIDRLDEKLTDGVTISAETEIIEKIFEAAQKRQEESQEPQGGQPGNMDAMLQMMKNMMGQQEGEKPGEQTDEDLESKESENSQNAKHQEKHSDTLNNNQQSAADKNKETRTISKSSGTSGADLPSEFRKALDAYNK